MNHAVSSNPLVEGFFDPATFTISYIVYAKGQSECAIVDSVLDYDPKSGRTSTHSADKLMAWMNERRLTPLYILETHAHADHLSAAPYIQKKMGGKIVIGNNIATVQDSFKTIFNLEADFATDGSQFGLLLKDGEILHIGGLSLKAMAVPGHTPACMAYQIGDSIFVGDTLFMPDVGTARCDFPGGNAHTLFASIKKVLSLPSTTRLLMCHDYPPLNESGEARAPAWSCTVADQRSSNIHVRDGISEDEFVAMRTKRDATLAMPVLILPSVQVNIRAGHLPPPESNGVSYLKIPVDAL